ncbi:MAG: Gfo/Idh/MocA family oxidoreductase [Prevotellaceae bacterium]|jgi:predicted dehydrogenase|nr:Gfo/Idh/MocA family oxidoreductase [Prevotellaceae bacterium]
MQTIKWGIIGCGNVCEKKSGPAFYKIDGSELVAVMRRDGEKAKDFALRHGAKRWYSDAAELIKDPEVNAVYVATPPSTHKHYAIEAMRAGKPVYVEKPMAINYAECMEMIRISEETGQKLFPAFYRRALPYFLKVKEIVESGAIGKPLQASVVQYRPASASDVLQTAHSWRVDKAIAGDGYFYDLAPHALDILDYILGETEDAKGFAANMQGFYNASDSISAALRFKSGATAVVQYCFVASEKSGSEQACIIGTKGKVEFNIFSFEPIRLLAETGEERYTIVQPEHIQMPLIQTIVDELHGVGTCPSTARSGARTARIMDLIFGKEEVV